MKLVFEREELTADDNVHVDFSIPDWKDPNLCEHGMSAWLCMGPMHYPTHEQEMRGEYF